MSLTKLTLVIAAFSMPACNSSESSTPYKPQSKSEKACIKSIKQEVKNLYSMQSDLFAEHVNSNDGFIPQLIYDRRRMEAACFKLAQCHESGEPIKSIEFAECINGWTSESS